MTQNNHIQFFHEKLRAMIEAGHMVFGENDEDVCIVDPDTFYSSTIHEFNVCRDAYTFKQLMTSYNFYEVKSEVSQTSHVYWAKGFSASGIDKRFFGVFKHMDQLITESEAERLVGFTFKPPCIETTTGLKRAREEHTPVTPEMTVHSPPVPAKPTPSDVKQLLNVYVNRAVHQLSLQIQENMQNQIQQLQQQMQHSLTQMQAQLQLQVQQQVQEELDRFSQQLAKNDTRDVEAAVCILDLKKKA